MIKTGYIFIFITIAKATTFAQIKTNDLKSLNIKGNVKTITHLTGLMDWGSDARTYDSTITYYNTNGNMDSVLFWNLDKDNKEFSRQTYNYKNKSKVIIKKTKTYQSKYDEKPENILLNGEKYWMNDSVICSVFFNESKEKRFESYTYINKSGRTSRVISKQYLDNKIWRHYQNRYFPDDLLNIEYCLSDDLIHEDKIADTSKLTYLMLDKFSNPTQTKFVGKKFNEIKKTNYTYYDYKSLPIAKQPEIKLENNFESNYCEIKDHVFYNPYFGIKLSLPKTWTFQTKKTIANEYDKVESVLAFEQFDGSYKNAVNTNWNENTLILVSKYKNVSDSIFNPNISIVFEDIGYRYTNGREYLLDIIKLLKTSTLNTTIDSDINYNFFGTYGFATMQSILKINSKTKVPIEIQQVTNTIVLKGKYAFSIIYTYHTTDEKNELESILEKIRWD